MEVIDNFLRESDFKNIQHILLDSRIPWYYNPFILSRLGDLDSNFQFTHAFICKKMQKKSEFLPVVYPIGDALGIKKVYRIKGNLTPRTKEHCFTGYHIDGFECPHTAIYYINTNNGWTDFENGDKVKSVANRVVIFDSELKHQAVTCTDEKVRVVINFNYA